MIRLGSTADPSAIDLIKAAISDWQDRIRSTTNANAARDSPPFGIRYVSSSAPADIIITLTDKTDPSLGYTKMYSTVGRVEKAEVTIATKTAMGLPLDRADIQNIAAHEIGHALGLGHSSTYGDLMHGSYDFITTSWITHPSSCDIDRILLIYLKDGSGFSAPNSIPHDRLYQCSG